MATPAFDTCAVCGNGPHKAYGKVHGEFVSLQLAERQSLAHRGEISDLGRVVLHNSSLCPDCGFKRAGQQ